MHIIRNYQKIPEIAQNIALALGNFDGLHLGHQQVLKKTIAIAKKRNVKSAVISFEPHPLNLLKNIQNIRISSLQDKIKLVSDIGIDILFLIRFNKELANLSAEEFLTEILVKNIKAKHLVVGHDFIFGKNRSGNASYLKAKAKIFNYDLTQISPHKCNSNNIIYSSTKIRDFLSSGDLDIVKTLLGKNYTITGRVVEGNNLGSKIGYKTANIKLKDLYRIKYGVYAVQVNLFQQHKTYNAIANIGVRPTIVGKKEEFLEVHIFDFNDNIYGNKITIKFISFIRAEQKFDDISQLKLQIDKDCKRTMEILNLEK